MIGYMATRHKLVLQSRKPQMYRTDRDLETPKICATPGYDYDSGYALTSSHPGASLILIDAESHLDCRYAGNGDVLPPNSA